MSFSCPMSKGSTHLPAENMGSALPIWATWHQDPPSFVRGALFLPFLLPWFPWKWSMEEEGGLCEYGVFSWYLLWGGGHHRHLTMVCVLLPHMKGLCGGFLTEAMHKQVMHSQVNLSIQTTQSHAHHRHRTLVYLRSLNRGLGWQISHTMLTETGQFSPCS